MEKPRRSGADEQELSQRILECEGVLRITQDLTLGLLHKLNNVMTAVYFSADGCEVELEPGHPARDMLKALTDSVRQAQQLVRRTAEVNFTLGGVETAYQDLNRLVKDDEDLTRILLPKSVSLEVVTATVPLIVQISIADFRRIILNFTTNARDALGADPKARVSTFPAHDLNPDEYVPNLPEELRDGAAFAVWDNGAGVAEKDLPRLGEPFFSTRSDRLGLGLYQAGLAAGKNGGMIAARRTAKEGAQFICVLPRLATL